MDGDIQQNINVYDEYFRNVADGIFQYIVPPSEDLDRLLRKEGLHPGPGDIGLDFGCGEGRNSRYLSDLGYSVIATDVSKGTLAAARSRLGKYAVDLRSMAPDEPLPIEDETIALVVAWAVLHWLGRGSSFQFYLREFKRVMKPGAHMLFTMPTERHFLKTKYAVKQSGDRYHCEYDGARSGCMLYSPDLNTLKSLLKANGFQVLRTMSYDWCEEGNENDLEHPFSMYAFSARAIP